MYTNAWHLVYIIEALRRVEKLAGRSVKFHKVDITSEQEIDAIFEKYTFWAVIHFAALKVSTKLGDFPRAEYSMVPPVIPYSHHLFSCRLLASLPDYH